MNGMSTTWGYKMKCETCRVESPEFPSSELGERWVIDHTRFFHPQSLEAIRAKALAGEWSGNDVFVDPLDIPRR